MPVKDKINKAPVWTVIYDSPGASWGCWHVEFGRKDGPLIDLKTAVMLTQRYFEKHKVTKSLSEVRILFPASYFQGHYIGHQNFYYPDGDDYKACLKQNEKPRKLSKQSNR